MGDLGEVELLRGSTLEDVQNVLEGSTISDKRWDSLTTPCVYLHTQRALEENGLYNPAISPFRTYQFVSETHHCIVPSSLQRNMQVSQPVK